MHLDKPLVAQYGYWLGDALQGDLGISLVTRRDVTDDIREGGYILPDGRMLNRALVREGYGYADPRFDHKYKSEFARLQREAIKAERGLWKDVSPSDLPYHSRNVKLPKR